MMVLASSTEYISVPVDGPKGVDLAQFPVSMAVIPDDGSEPADADYHQANWVEGAARWLPTAGEFTPGMYMVFVRVIAAPEDIRLQSGRLRVGDTR